MKVLSALVAGAFADCGPDASYGGAFWPGQSAEDPCGIHYVDQSVGPNQKCTLTINDPAAYPHFITLGGVFVTSQQMPGDYQYFFHTYDNWAGNYAGVDVTIFWHNPTFPETTGCLDADKVCITCQPETVDYDGDGMPGPVQGVYLGNFMHDFRHSQPSCVNVPIANSAGHLAGTVYTVTLYDEYANVVPIENIASHYGHEITAMGYDGASGHSSSSGTFDLHVGCTDFEGQFLYFSFCHSSNVESSGWFSTVTAYNEGTANCATTTAAPYVAPAAYNEPAKNDNYAAQAVNADSSYGAAMTDPYASNAAPAAGTYDTSGYQAPAAPAASGADTYNMYAPAAAEAVAAAPVATDTYSDPYASMAAATDYQDPYAAYQDPYAQPAASGTYQDPYAQPAASAVYQDPYAQPAASATYTDPYAAAPVAADTKPARPQKGGKGKGKNKNKNKNPNQRQLGEYDNYDAYGNYDEYGMNATEYGYDYRK